MKVRNVQKWVYMGVRFELRIGLGFSKKCLVLLWCKSFLE
jgi:hypothetical protein